MHNRRGGWGGGGREAASQRLREALPASIALKATFCTMDAPRLGSVVMGAAPPNGARARHAAPSCGRVEVCLGPTAAEYGARWAGGR